MSETFAQESTPSRHGRAAVALKALRFAGLVLLATVLLPTVPLLGSRRAHRIVRWWHGRALRVLGVQLTIDGKAPAQPMLIVANHCSWLDIIVLGHAFDAAFVSKAEIDGWPLVGRFARAAGTLFLARGAGQTGETTRRILAVLDSGRSVLFFPEGTTTVSPMPQRFHARLFAAAIEGGYPVLPVGLHYRDESTPADRHHTTIPWVDGAPLWPNFRNLFRLRRVEAALRPCEPIDPHGRDRRALAAASEQAISRRQATADAQPRGGPQPGSAA